MKSVIIIDNTLPIGIAANTAAILGITLGRRAEELLGADVADADGVQHAGITRLPLPILAAPPAVLGVMRRSLQSKEYAEVLVVGFTRTAQGCMTYDEYVQRMGEQPFESLEYLGLALYGMDGKIRQLSGGLPLLGTPPKERKPAAATADAVRT